MNNAEKSERLMQATAALLAAAPDKELNIVILNKAIFYLDLVSLRDLFQRQVRHFEVSLVGALLHF